MTKTPTPALVSDLSRPDNLPGAAEHVDFVSTHASWVFMTERDVFKIKRPVDYGFLDYSTADKRRHFCEEEVRLNRRTAPSVYLGVEPVRRDDRGHSLVRRGEVVDWAVHMRRLPDSRSALALVRDGALGPRDVAAVAAVAADLYRRAEAHPPDPEALRENFEENFVQAEPFVGRWLTGDLLAELRERQRRWLAAVAPLLADRPARDGHGDLRLEHVYLLEEGPVLIDCIEFNARFRIADPALDAAFLAMDLVWRDRRDLAEHLLAAFADASEDFDLYPLIDGYLSYRAFVRAKVACLVTAGEDTPAHVVERKGREAASLFRLARDVLAHERGTPRLIAVAGIIASGKSTVARLVADRLRVPVVSADATRKHLAGLPRETRGGPELYTSEMNRRVHDEILRRARSVLEGGRSVILDTSFRSRRLRGRARELAVAAQADFVLVECRVSEEVARDRLRTRRGGVSDAREDLLEEFVAGFEPVEELPAEAHVVLDTARPLPEAEEELRRSGVLPGVGEDL